MTYKPGDLVTINIPRSDHNRNITDLWQFNGHTAVVKEVHTGYMTLHGVKSRKGIDFAIGEYMVTPADKYAGI